MTKYYYVYILSNKYHTVFYVGVTSNLLSRTWKHKSKIFTGFTDKYQVNKLVYYSIFEDVNEAIKFEKQLKRWKRQWKIKLIEKDNPKWLDLYEEMSK